ncbi:MAG TPA: glycerol-3-phosphate dehydrogenase/oxidase [Cryomorphaceae bacterium]|nr:glycerol-3-phosphate dehydrogenase/oxidase [Cryomorphaceae bacterium]
MNREEMIEKLEAHPDQVWDVLVIGGGASGLGAALEAASRGYKTLLLEQADFAKGTSSRSTKLIHGGVRYLAQGDISLVYEALHERGLLRQNAPHLVSNQKFVIPNYDWWEGPFYTVGLKVYDMMAGKLGLGPSVGITKAETMEAIPNIKEEGLRGGVIYQDGQFDDSRLAINLAQTIAENDGVIVNYFRVVNLLKNSDSMVEGVQAVDVESEKEYSIGAKAVINATGVFVDEILKMDDEDAKRTIVPSQGVHVVLDREFLSGDSAILIPRTDDGRVLFAVPWYNKVVVGTTDTLVDEPSLEPRALEEEVRFILSTAGRYLTRAPSRADVLSIFAGLRPLVAPKSDSKKTKEISRGHKINVSLSGMLTMTGGKWTTYRKMGEDAIDQAIIVAGLHERPSVSKHLPIHGFEQEVPSDDLLRFYGVDRHRIREIIKNDADMAEKLHPSLSFIKAEVIWAVREEMARTIEDVLARRVRALFLDARASIDMSGVVAQLMAKELGWAEAKVSDEIERYKALAKGYLLQ